MPEQLSWTTGYLPQHLRSRAPSMEEYDYSPHQSSTYKPPSIPINFEAARGSGDSEGLNNQPESGDDDGDTELEIRARNLVNIP